MRKTQRITRCIPTTWIRLGRFQMRNHIFKNLSLSASLLLLTSTLTLAPPNDASALSDPLNAPCATVDVVFARGSGQKLNAKDAEQFKKNIQNGMSSLKGSTINYYELGSQTINGSKYPAVKISEDLEGFNNAREAFFDKKGISNYSLSVKQGTNELSSFINHRIKKCESEGKTAKFILAGYSQGAHVVGDTYLKSLTDKQRSHIVFNALFGDPKLNLPEGRGSYDFFTYKNDACQGKNFSVYRRSVPDCKVHSGILNAREPYLPKNWEDTTGLWCNDHDSICGIYDGSHYALNDGLDYRLNKGHSTYDLDPSGDAAKEAISKLVDNLPTEEIEFDESHLKKVLSPIKLGFTGIDVAFVIDSTGSMSWKIDSAKEYAQNISNSLKKFNGRVALVEYRDAGDEFTAKILSNFDSDTTEFTNNLINISVDGGGDSPEALLHALNTAFEGLDWKHGATKAAIVLTDDTFHNPDQVDGSSLDYIVKRSLEIDPVNIYPVVDASLASSYQELAERTSGQVIIDNGNAGTALEEALLKIETRPVVRLPLSNYYLSPGESAHFDASSSYSVESEIVRWDWDFNGDGIFDLENGSSRVDHVYPEMGDYNVNVQATDKLGGIASHSVPVHVGTVNPYQGVPLPADSVSVIESEGNAILSWKSDNKDIDYWVVTIDGFPYAKVPAEENSFVIEDVSSLPDKSEIAFGVVPVSPEGKLGSPNVAYLQNSSQEPVGPSASPDPGEGSDKQSTDPKPTQPAEISKPEQSLPSDSEPTGSSGTSDASYSSSSASQQPSQPRIENQISGVHEVEQRNSGEEQRNNGWLAKTGESFGGIIFVSIIMLGAGSLILGYRLKKH